MKILISTSSFGVVEKKPLKILEDAGIKVVLSGLGRKLKVEEITDLATDCVGIIAGTEPLTRNVLRQLNNLKVISRVGAGMDSVDIEAAKELGISVYNTPYGPTQAVAELTIAFILDLLRGVSRADAAIRQGIWKKRMGALMEGKTVGIIGLGRIGRRVAFLAKAFGCKVIGCDICPDETWAMANDVTLLKFQSLLKEADIISLHIPCENKNEPIVSEKELALIKPSAYLINASRGGLVDEEALFKALKDKRLAGAAIDTFANEPYKGPLKELDNVVLSPHVGSYAAEARTKMELQAVENLLEGLGLTVETK